MWEIRYCWNRIPLKQNIANVIDNFVGYAFPGNNILHHFTAQKNEVFH